MTNTSCTFTDEIHTSFALLYNKMKQNFNFVRAQSSTEFGDTLEDLEVDWTSTPEKEIAATLEAYRVKASEWFLENGYY